MGNKITIPKEWESTNDWDSHRPMLWFILNKLKPDFAVECGIGHGSTALIDSVCEKFMAIETDTDWYAKFFGIINGVVININKWDDIKPIEADFLFIDCKPGESRKNIIKKCSETSKVIVVHDTEPGAEYVYGLSTILSTFRYRLDYRPEGKPHTTAVSKTIDFREWKIPQELTSFMTAVDQKSMNH